MNADRSPGHRRAGRAGEPPSDITSTFEPRPRAYTPGAMVARVWSGLMCLETQGTRGGRQKLDLDGAAESPTHGRPDSTCVSEVPRWACRWRRSASRCIPDGRSGRNVGMGTGVADRPEVGRAERRLGLKSMGPSAGRVGALGGSRETRRNSNFDRVASFKFPPLFSTSATLKPVRVLYYSAFFNPPIPAKNHAERCDFANPACIRSNGTMYWGGILDRQMHRGLVHALDRYY